MGDHRHADIVVTRRLWEQVCQQLVDNWEDLDARAQNQARERIVKRWRSIRDRFKKELNKDAGPEWIWWTQEQVEVCKGPVVPQINDGELKYRRQHSGSCRVEPFWGDPSGVRHRGTLRQSRPLCTFPHI
ncbi:uncharacterized protein LOC143769229 isoform X1 [Ranitomeya variabilis]|uniref:uncharacterized protein LOC143769229 isoform X1 n=1 Tax=Ranitomeya variabilis TaxID=490064 RepID=UPI0040565E94